jgi:hypothetical protein
MIPRTLFSDEHEIFRATAAVADENASTPRALGGTGPHRPRGLAEPASKPARPTVPEEFGGRHGFLYNIVIVEKSRLGLSASAGPHDIGAIHRQLRQPAIKASTCHDDPAR